MAITELDQPYEMPASAREQLDADGFIRLSGVLSPETINYYEPVITQKVLDLNTMHVPLEERSTYDRAFLQVSNLWEHDETVRELVFSPRLAQLAADLLGVDGVRLYHDQALYKESAGGFTPWHADQYYWPLSNDRSITIWLPLQDTPIEMGALEFARGSHHFEHGRDLPISDDSEAQLQKSLSEQGFPVSQAPYALGDASFHLGWTFHRAGGNQSSIPRRVMTVIYVDADVRATEPTNEHQQRDLATWMPGVAVGGVADSPLNPVLFRR